MQECENSAKGSDVKRVTVRTGGAGHAHSGVANSDSVLAVKKGTSLPANGKMVTLGR